MKILFLIIFVFIFNFAFSDLKAGDAYNLWLQYSPIENPEQKEQIKNIFSEVYLSHNSSIFNAIKEELKRAGEGMTGNSQEVKYELTSETNLIIGTSRNCDLFATPVFKDKLNDLGDEGFLIDYINHDGREILVVAANEDAGAMYGSFHLLRLLQMDDGLLTLPVSDTPKIRHRLLNHWDNPDRTVERGYAGFSIWDWHRLPDYIDQQYIDYARANASIGINGTVLTNVNANSYVLTPQFIDKVAALADVFSQYGIKIYLTARFSSPIEIGGLTTADPLDPQVREWWRMKIDEIYESIPDFGGFLVKANSEGQPGPQDYGRSHADGANMFAEALAPYGGIVMWRAFVYSSEIPDDRAKQAYNEFKPLDGIFRKNVIIQVKNGAIDFQPREPFHPLFGAMPLTSLAPEFQITQEYLGQGTHLVYLAPLFKECLESDTYADGNSATVAQIIDGSHYKNELTAIAGVSNIGTDNNWTGHLFGQSNWYAFGRLAWDHNLSSEEIAEEWIRMTFGNSERLVSDVKLVMMVSREAAVNYMTPLGLHHIMARHHHYGPGPWVEGGRVDWTSVYYHKADSAGIGFDRTETGSNALSQYENRVIQMYSDPVKCPEEFLLWFHHLPWDFMLNSGNILWDELCLRYQKGVNTVISMREIWNSLSDEVDSQRFEQVNALLKIQEDEAEWWKNACLLYFRKFSGLDFPYGMDAPEGDLEDFMKMEFPYAPGI